jgi:poly(A) polymerase
MILNPIQKIAPPEWMASKDTQKLMAAIGGDEGSSRFVGGCVRNTLMGVDVSDIDIATQFTPDEVIEKLKAVNIKVIPTGIDHGTVTAVVDGQPFEITTLRQDVATDGRHAEVSFTEDWVQDSMRRDFTMNTLLADMEGNIYDPTERGLSDLNARKVVFVGDPKKRIAEDYLRILRFFRFHAFYGRGEMDAGALVACQAAADKISSLSRERITQEFLKILSIDNAANTTKIMFNNNILRNVLGGDYEEKTLKELCDLQVRYDDVQLMSRLFVLAGNKSRFYDDTFRLSHVQKNFLVKLEMAFNSVLYRDDKTLKKAIYHHGNALMLQGYFLVLANGGGQIDKALLDILQNWQAPKCPITGEMLLAEGYVTGPDLGQELARRQEEWLEEVL